MRWNSLSRKWLRVEIPEWASCQIVSCAKYLGMFLGPVVGNANWRAPTTKWTKRTKEFANNGAQLGTSISMYHRRAQSVLAYPSNFVFLPLEYLRTERHLIGKLLHLPGNAMASSAFFSLGKWHSYYILSSLAYNLASLMRSALVTDRLYLNMFYTLRDNVNKLVDQHSLQDITRIRTSLSPANWDSLPMVAILKSASMAFPDYPLFARAGRLALQVFRDEQASNPNFRKGIQSKMARTIQGVIFEDTLPLLVDARLPHLGLLLPDRCVPSRERWETMRSTLAHLSCYQAFVIIRTWANAWTTSHRCHELVFLECLCGCKSRCRSKNDSVSSSCSSTSSPSSTSYSSSSAASEDSELQLRAFSTLVAKENMDTLQHYLRCPILWDTLDSVLHQTRYQYANRPVPADPYERACLSNPCESNFLNLLVVTNSYHYLKNELQASCHKMIRKREFVALDKEIRDVMYANLFKSRSYFKEEMIKSDANMNTASFSSTPPIVTVFSPSYVLPTEGSGRKKIGTFRRVKDDTRSSMLDFRGPDFTQMQSTLIFGHNARSGPDNAPPPRLGNGLVSLPPLVRMRTPSVMDS